VKFLRHLAATALVVAVVVVLGLAWNHFAASTLVGRVPSPLQREITHSQPRGRVPGHGPGVVRNGGLNLGLTSMLDPVNLPVLRHTVVIEVGVIAAVVIIDVGRRKARRARPAAPPGPPPTQPLSGDDG
jgi:hypothetical protein